MKLTLYLIQQDIDTPSEARDLSKIQQKQLAIELKAYFGQKTAFKDAFTGECIASFWQVCPDDSDTPLYDFWEINTDSGGVFYTNTTDETGVEMIQGAFDVQIQFVDDPQSPVLADALAEAERKKRPDPNYELNEAGEVVEFKVTELIPTDPKGWTRFLKNQKASERLVRKYYAGFNKSNWSLVCQTSALSEAFLAEFANKVNWDVASQYQRLSESFIREYQKRLNWTKISFYQKLSEAFLREFQDKLNWDYVSSQQIMSEAFIREFSERISWPIISWAQQMSEEFIREFQERIHWENLLSYQRMSDAFLHEFVPKFDWSCWYKVSCCQALSNAFLAEFGKHILWNAFSMNPYITDEQLDIYQDRLEWRTVIIFGRSLSEPLLRMFEQRISQAEALRKDTWTYILKNKKKFEISDVLRQEITAKYLV